MTSFAQALANRRANPEDDTFIIAKSTSGEIGRFGSAGLAELVGIDIRKAAVSTSGRLTADDIASMVGVAIQKAIQARPVTVETTPGAPVQTPASIGEAMHQHITAQRRVGETHAAATDRLATSGDPVFAQLYAAGRQQQGADTARARAHAAVADVSPVAKAYDAVDAAARVIVSKAASEGRAMSHEAGVLAALNENPNLYAAHRAAHRNRRGA